MLVYAHLGRDFHRFVHGEHASVNILDAIRCTNALKTSNVRRTELDCAYWIADE